MISTIHAANLRYGHVALVDDQQIVLREIIDQTEWATSGRTSVEVARIVLNPGTIPQLLDHFEIILDPLFESSGFGRFSDRFEVFALFAQIELNHPNGLLDPLPRSHKQIGRIDDHPFLSLESLSRHRIDRIDHLDLVVEEDDPVTLLPVSGKDIDRIALYAKRSWTEIGLTPRVKCIDQRI